MPAQVYRSSEISLTTSIIMKEKYLLSQEGINSNEVKAHVRDICGRLNDHVNIPSRPFLLRPNPIDPMISRHEVSTGVTDDRDVELPQSFKNILPETILV